MLEIQTGLFFLLGFLIALVMLGAVVWFLPFELVIKYSRGEKENQLFINGSALQGRVRIELGPYFLGKQEPKQQEPWPARGIWSVAAKAVSGLEKSRIWLRKWGGILSELRLREWYWRTEIGLENPARTAVAAGVIWGIKGWVWARINKGRKAEKVRSQVEVYPDYWQKKLNIDLRLVLEGRLGPVLWRWWKGRSKLRG